MGWCGVSDRVALIVLAIAAVLEIINVAVAMMTGRPTLAAIDLMFTTTGGAVLTEALTRRRSSSRSGKTNGRDA